MEYTQTTPCVGIRGAYRAYGYGLESRAGEQGLRMMLGHGPLLEVIFQYACVSVWVFIVNIYMLARVCVCILYLSVCIYMYIYIYIYTHIYIYIHIYIYTYIYIYISSTFMYGHFEIDS